MSREVQCISHGIRIKTKMFILFISIEYSTYVWARAITQMKQIKCLKNRKERNDNIFICRCRQKRAKTPIENFYNW